jgi:hypothetical protein
VSTSSVQTAPGPGPAALTHDEIQHLIDQAASFQTYVIPSDGAVAAVHGPGGIIGFSARESIHRFQIDLQLPSAALGVRAANIVGEQLATVEILWLLVPDDFVALPRLRPPATTLDPYRSQRFVMLQTTVEFKSEQGGFQSFGAGRTFPTIVGGQPKLVAAAVGNMVSSTGRFRNHDGNFTVCGELDPQRGFTGNIMIRILDFNGDLRSSGDLPAIQPLPDPDPQTTFLSWIAQKRPDMTQENHFSLTPTGEVRGLNIPVDLKRVHVDAGVGPGGFNCLSLRLGEVMALEVGYGREPKARTPIDGTPLTPHQFEGVSEYTFYDSAHNVVGKFTANVVEGRSIDLGMPRAPQEPALRFGYFAPIVNGKGCFEGTRGMLYGTAGSVFAPPPFDHIISNLYVARIDDPEGRFRALDGGGVV